ncbi:hypothetical protein FRC07_003829 [Ceratobasidium sp. 392]|nr:hypothetical protein FRC07_003829 [Ceratobasidium sp. 392]
MATIPRPTDAELSGVDKGPSEDDTVGELSSPLDLAPKPQATMADPEPLAPPTGPFVFGSPRYSVSNTQFGNAAAAVLREMNARMGVSSSTQAVSLQQLENVMANKTFGPDPTARIEKKADTRFGNHHAKEFAKMDSIANHYSVTASQANKRKSRHEPSSSVDSSSNKIFTLPPHIVEPPTLPERSAKRARLSTIDGEEPGKPSEASTSTTESNVLRDSPLVRADLERKRRPSAARASLAGRKSAATPRKSAPRQPPPAPSSRFGFVGRMVRSVWGGGSKKEKEEEKKKDEKGKAKEKLAPPAPVQTSVAKKFPSVPTEEPVHVPNFPAVPKTRPASAAGIGMGRPSSVVPKANRSRSATTAKIGPARPTVGAGGEDGRKSSAGIRSEYGVRGAQSRPGSSVGVNTAQVRAGSAAGVSASTRTRPASTLFAPTAASLARQGTALSKAAPKLSTVSTVSKPAVTKTAARALPVPPTNIGRAATSGAALSPSARMASPPIRASSVMSSAGRGALSPAASAQSSTAASRKSAVSSPVGRKSTTTQGTRSPTNGAGAGTSPRKSIFTTPLTIDAMTMRGSAPTIQPFRLSPEKKIAAAPPAAATSSKPAVKPSTAATTNTTTTVSRTQRRPRISRSKVIARLEEKRAAAATANKSPAVSPVSKARSSAHIRRSLGVVAARKALDADMDRKARMRKSEAARRKSKATPALGRRSEGAVLRRNRHDDVEMDG